LRNTVPTKAVKISIKLVVRHMLRLTVSVHGGVLLIIVARELPFFLDAFGTDPSGIRIAVTQFVKKPAAHFFFDAPIALRAKTHDVFALPRSIQVWTAGLPG
jgi:hypothetical protein